MIKLFGVFVMNRENTREIMVGNLPLGGNNITNDIAYVLQISIEEAERLKRQYGLALKSYINNDNEIMLKYISNQCAQQKLAMY